MCQERWFFRYRGLYLYIVQLFEYFVRKSSSHLFVSQLVFFIKTLIENAHCAAHEARKHFQKKSNTSQRWISATFIYRLVAFLIKYNLQMNLLQSVCQFIVRNDTLKWSWVKNASLERRRPTRGIHSLGLGTYMLVYENLSLARGMKTPVRETCHETPRKLFEIHYSAKITA